MKNNLQFAFLFYCLSFPSVQASELNLAYGYGARNDDLRWAIAGNIFGTSPNIMSELTWRNIKGRTSTLGLEYLTASGLLLRVDYGLTNFNLGGEVQDSDYAFDNRTGENSRSLGTTHGSNARDISLLIGRRFYLNEPQSWMVTPVCGLSRNVTDLRVNNLIQVIPSTGSNPNPENRYLSQFYMLMAGAETLWWIAPNFGLEAKWHFNWLNYHAEADWNGLVPFQHPVSFYHNGKGSGNEWSTGVIARANKKWTLELLYSLRKDILQNGIDTANLANGNQQSTLLKDVEWSSAATFLVLRRTLY